MHYKTTLEIGEKGMGLIESEIFIYQIQRVSEIYGVKMNVKYKNETIQSGRRQNGSTNPTFDEIVDFIATEHPPYSKFAISIEGADKEELNYKTSLFDLVENCKVEQLVGHKKITYKFLKEI